MKRKIINIDETKCNGCGNCVPNCAEGALKIIDGKARLISDLFCDGLGACIGHCPEGAITIEEKEAAPYDERKTMEKNIIPAGENTITEHLKHLKEHNEEEYFQQAIEVLKENNIEINTEKLFAKKQKAGCASGGCPGSKTIDNTSSNNDTKSSNGDTSSQLRQWPVQLHLISPNASYFKKADVVLAADCVAFSMGNFHQNHLKGKSLAIACPKLDSGKESYIEKITAMIDEAKINTLTVIRMEVPCCGGLISIAKEALKRADRNIPIKEIVIGTNGDVLSEKWV